MFPLWLGSEDKPQSFGQKKTSIKSRSCEVKKTRIYDWLHQLSK